MTTTTTNTAKLRVNLTSREFEIEGSEEFVTSHSELFKNLLTQLDHKSVAPPTHNGQKKEVQNSHQRSESVPESFGEYFHKLTNDAKDVDMVLVAGHYAQLSSGEGYFTTNDVSTLLLDQGVKLSNPSRSVKLNVDSKRVIQLTKGKFKVSKDGVSELQSLLSSE